MPNHAQPADAPVYGTRPQKPGMYLGLFHGRNTPHEAMNGWGFDGPALGPLKHVHTTYACSMNVEFTSLSDAQQIALRSIDHVQRGPLQGRTDRFRTCYGSQGKAACQ